MDGLSVSVSLHNARGSVLGTPPDISANDEMLKADGTSRMLKADGSSVMKKAN